MKKWISIAKIIWALTVLILLIVICFKVFELKADINETHRLIINTGLSIIQRIK